MMKGLKRLAGGGMLLLELRGMRRELAALTAVTERIAKALELQNAHAWPHDYQAPDPDLPAVEVSYVTDDDIREWMDAELALTQARGSAPTEDEVLVEVARRRSLSASPSGAR